MSILECKGLSKRFGAVTALDGISFTIEPGLSLIHISPWR